MSLQNGEPSLDTVHVRPIEARFSPEVALRHASGGRTSPPVYSWPLKRRRKVASTAAPVTPPDCAEHIARASPCRHCVAARSQYAEHSGVITFADWSALLQPFALPLLRGHRAGHTFIASGFPLRRSSLVMRLIRSRPPTVKRAATFE